MNNFNGINSTDMGYIATARYSAQTIDSRSMAKLTDVATTVAKQVPRELLERTDPAWLAVGAIQLLNLYPLHIWKLKEIRGIVNRIRQSNSGSALGTLWRAVNKDPDCKMQAWQRIMINRAINAKVGTWHQ